jgi:hypothetical protein
MKRDNCEINSLNVIYSLLDYLIPNSQSSLESSPELGSGEVDSLNVIQMSFDYLMLPQTHCNYLFPNSWNSLEFSPGLGLGAGLGLGC